MPYSKKMRDSLIEKYRETGKSISKLAEEEGIPRSTVANWIKIAKKEGRIMPSNSNEPANWSSKEKHMAVLETASMSEIEIAEYCRKKGIYPQQLTRWKEACENANDWQQVSDRQLKNTLKMEKEKNKKLEKELARKEKALAETAALLVLRKKVQAIWGDSEEE
jgi:transposase-like protein